MQKISADNDFIYLFIALVALLFSTALLQEINIGASEESFALIFFLVLVLGVNSVRKERTWMWTVYFLSFLVVALYLLHTLFSVSFTALINLFIMLLFFMGTFYSSYAQILLRKHIDTNLIIGSLVLYLLLGLIWTIFYLMLLMVYPDAFNGLEAIAWQENFARVAYYSFVTLTTLGYGDISPKNGVAEFFVYAEAIVGVFYMAIIVASLVSARLGQLQVESPSDE